MYNDYYLQSIDNKLSTSNNNLNTIIQNQNAIIQNQQTIISGDNAFHNTIRQDFVSFYTLLLAIGFIVCLTFGAELVEHYFGIKKG